MTDPGTALSRCDTLMLDMDGTVLDLAFDNYVWKQLIPAAYARLNDLPEDVARRELFGRYRSVQGRLDWYCLDHWSERLGLDVLALHRSVNHRIRFLPGARHFLESMASHRVRMLLVTNSHPDTLALKSEVTGIIDFFDAVYTSHGFGHAKEDQSFWRALQQAEGFDPQRSLFVDDTTPVLRSAARYGIGMLINITRPDSTEPSRHEPAFAGIETLAELLP